MFLKNIKKLQFLDVLLMVSLLLVGGFHVYVSCAISAALCVYLIIKISKNKKLVLEKSIIALAVTVIVAFYGLTCFWAIDPGMAWIGLCKFLPVLLYAVSLWQADDHGAVLEKLPYFGAATVLLSVAGMLLPITSNFFAVAGRLAGFFQYPNTFALFLLVCELLLLKKSSLKAIDYFVLAVLIGGLLYTGSRTVFVLFVLSNLVLFMLGGRKKLKVALIGLGVIAVLAALVLIFGKETVLYRYMTISFTESTFVGRLLYFIDALPLLLKHPFGMGYMGYYYAQGGVQTGVYSVMYAHNDFLQIFLDVGLIPGLLFVVAIVLFLVKKGVPVNYKVIVGTVCLHSLFDFDLQFIAMFMLLVLLMLQGGGTKIEFKKDMLLIKAVLSVCVALSVYFAVALALAHFGQNELSDKMYPYNTQNKLSMLQAEEELDAANAIADEILKQNSRCYLPYSIKAKYAYSKGDFASLIENEHKVFERSPFTHSEYEDYCRMLINGIALYERSGDQASAKVCQKELLAAKKRLEANTKKLSRLGKMIDDQPVTELSEDILYYIEQMEK